MVLQKKGNVKTSPVKDETKSVPVNKRASVSRRSPGRPKSPGRTRSPGRGKLETSKEKSPSRKSPSRKSPSRRKSVDLSKSPKTPLVKSGRLTPTRRSPIRKSPARITTTNVASEDKQKESAIPILRKKKVIETDTESDTADEKVEVKEKPKAAVRGRTRTDLIEKLLDGFTKEPSVESNSSTFLKRVTRSQNREVERIVHLKHFETTKRLAEFSDEDELIKDPSTLKNDESKGTDGWIGAFTFMLSLPILTCWFFIECHKRTCSFEDFSLDFKKKHFFAWYDFGTALLAYLGFFILLGLLSLVPWGRKVASLPDKQQKFVYLMNGIFSAIIVIVLSIVLEINGISVTRFIIDYFLYLHLASFLIGLLVTTIAYVRSFYAPISALNPHIVNKGKIYNFFMGRELHPRFYRIDWKVFVVRVMFISRFLIDLAFIFDSLGVDMQLNASERTFNVKSITLQPTCLVYFLLNSIFAFDGLIFEYTSVTSKRIQQEAFGYFIGVTYLVAPFISCFITKYIVEHDVQLAYWKLVLITSIFLFGYIIYRGSNNQKDAFRKNPYSPTFSHLETVPTTQGKKLLCSGFWGLVRNPNYLGHIIIELSMVPFVLYAPPVVFIILKVLFLWHCARKNNYDCKQKYGAAWDRYCNKVKYLLVPKIY